MPPYPVLPASPPASPRLAPTPKTLRVRIWKSNDITFEDFQRNQRSIECYEYNTEEEYQAALLAAWNDILTRSNGIIESEMQLHDDEIEYALADAVRESDEEEEKKEECECGEEATEKLLVGGTDEGNVYQSWCKDCVKESEAEMCC